MKYREYFFINLFSHVSCHGDGSQIKIVIDVANAKKLIPIHTVHE